MSKPKDVKEFVEKIDAGKKLNPKDLSSDQDLTIAIMNLISIEEHLIFSGAKTGKNSFYDLVEDIREMRKNLMLKVIPSYEGEVWCISKHLLSASMRLLEVGTKQQSLKRPKEAYKFFEQSYDLYTLFWGLNMNLIDTKDVKWIKDSEEEVKKVSEKLEQMKIPVKTEKVEDDKEIKPKPDDTDGGEGGGTFSRFKNFVKKAVDCCIE